MGGMLESLAAGALLLMSTPNAGPADAADARGAVVMLPSLPDSTGWGGMFAGVLGGSLVAGGGSQFPDQPLWRGGQKTFSDRVFVLAEPKGSWREASVRLPRAAAHFAAAPGEGAIQVAGGIGAEGALAEAFTVRAAGSEYVIDRLPSLPRPLVYAGAIVAAGRFYVAGGQHDPAVRAASREVWSLGLAGRETSWRREPDLPGTGVFLGAMAEVDGSLFHVGGVAFDGAGRSVQLRQVLRLAPGAAAWEELPPLPEARVGAVSPCAVIAGSRLLVVGGYAAAFAGERREHPGFSRQTWIYHLAERRWAEGPVLPHVAPVDRDATGDAGPAPMIAAPGVVWRDLYVAVGGEVRASVRTPAVVGIPLRGL